MHWNNTRRVRGERVNKRQAEKGKCDSFDEGPNLDTGKVRSIYNLRVNGGLSIMLRDRVHNSFTWHSGRASLYGLSPGPGGRMFVIEISQDATHAFVPNTIS